MPGTVEELTIEQRRAITRRLAPLYIAGALQSFQLWFAVEKPFQASIGMTQTQMALLAVVVNITLITSNIPLGVLADRWSRKGLLMVGGAISSVSSIIAVESHGFLAYTVAMVFFALCVAALSGGYDSVVYDTTLEETRDGSSFRRFYGRLRFFEGVALAISSILGGVVAATFEPRSAYLISAPFAAASVIALAFFREPVRHRHKSEDIAHSRLTASLKQLVLQRDTRWVVIALIVVTVGSSLMSQLDQLWLLALALPLPFYGPVNAAILASLGLGGHFAGMSRSTRNDIYVASSVLILSFGLLVKNDVSVIVAQCVTLGGLTFLAISLGQRLHAAIPSDVRTSTSSAVATLGMLVFAPTALLFGRLCETVTVFHAAWMAVTICGLSLLCVVWAHRASRVA